MAFKKTHTPARSLDKQGLHRRNIHNQGYDFSRLIEVMPELSGYTRDNGYGRVSIDFADPKAVKCLNRAILLADYHVLDWDIPDGALCPPIPGRVDYIHYLADLLQVNGKPLTGCNIKALDIGTGANGVYPLLGNSCYGWQFVATDIAQDSLANVAHIIERNPPMSHAISLRLQRDKQAIFTGIIQAGEMFEVSMCNPPFHESKQAAAQAASRKTSNLGRAKKQKSATALNFGGQDNELWCPGGELTFLTTMIKESLAFSHQCLWFTSLVSKGDNLAPCRKLLMEQGVADIQVIPMEQGNKLTRVIAWSYLAANHRQKWLKLKQQQPKFAHSPSLGI
ncbi:23S rRNA (adenine(1618)-N(6))-methyltransferase RlmF [Shewanella sp. NIFS-20-20]|uniref:23S rRNA (adenine(1618)-N(6))-methyltransferase RlmF n=1 Tax=Shewanella sp. NIFS-20-20 TaxID=2853806 RepID=UPI001C451111|nr:23S rRNA (adenine(1618)-N(6))-methyltransferase RlmF [Shewanella sp. NIFS-20-20]MBV7316056.1 23S rRNA (adenine(1618)-N(6))-methyltransferase RlmF [Shewanella sp. NIFS-20-20]